MTMTSLLCLLANLSRNRIPVIVDARAATKSKSNVYDDNKASDRIY